MSLDNRRTTVGWILQSGFHLRDGVGGTPPFTNLAPLN